MTLKVDRDPDPQWLNAIVGAWVPKIKVTMFRTEQQPDDRVQAFWSSLQVIFAEQIRQKELADFAVRQSETIARISRPFKTKKSR